MSVSLYRWTIACDDTLCPGDCDKCNFEGGYYDEPFGDRSWEYIEWLLSDGHRDYAADRVRQDPE